MKDIDQVALASKFTNPILMKIKRNAQFSVSDWIKEQELYWRPKIYQKKKVSYWNIFKKIRILSRTIFMIIKIFLKLTCPKNEFFL